MGKAKARKKQKKLMDEALDNQFFKGINMKKRLILVILILGLAILWAQELSPYRNIVHSSRCSDGKIRVQWMDALDLDLDLPTESWYSQNGADWQLADSEALGTSHFQTFIPYEFGQHLRWRLRTQVELMEQQLVYMHAPHMQDDQFPPELGQMGLIGNDAIGDSITVYQPYLDFTQTWCGVAENKLYSSMANVANSFPLINSIYSYNAYLTTITNPETVVDTLAYAMVHSFNIPGVLQPGLYKLRMGEENLPSFERIGDVESQILGGKLHHACELDDLFNDPDFGTWPNSVNALLLGSLSMTLSVDPETFTPTFGIGDYSVPAAIIFEDHFYQVDENTLPAVDNVFLANNTLSFEYFDEESDFPLIMELLLPDGQVLHPQPLGYEYSLQPITFNVDLPNPVSQVTLRYADNDIDIIEELHVLTGVSDPAQIPSALSCAMQNPFKAGNIRLSGLKQGDLKLEIFDLRGRKLGKIHEGSTSRGELDLPWDARVDGKALKNGLYILRVTQPHKTLLKRFVITK